jgi:hypothetical protein
MMAIRSDRLSWEVVRNHPEDTVGQALLLISQAWRNYAIR